MNELARRIEPTAVELVRELPLRLERAFDYLTQSDLRAHWLAPGPLEPRVGGEVVLKFEPDDSPRKDRPGARIEGRVLEFSPPCALSFTWTDPKSAGAPASKVTFALTASGAATRLTVTHRELAPATCAMTAAAWHTHLDLLLAHLKGEPAPVFPALFKPLRERYAALFA